MSEALLRCAEFVLVMAVRTGHARSCAYSHPHPCSPHIERTRKLIAAVQVDKAIDVATRRPRWNTLASLLP